MPPKKKIDKTLEPAKEKAPPKRKPKDKVEKPKLKTSSVVKVKLPTIKSFFFSTNNAVNSSKPQNKGNVLPKMTAAAKRKLDLANEVAHAQLAKPGSEAAIVKDETEPPKKKTRKITLKKSAVAHAQLAKPGSEAAIVKDETEPPKKKTRKITLKKSAGAGKSETKPKKVVKKMPVKRTKQTKTVLTDVTKIVPTIKTEVEPIDENKTLTTNESKTASTNKTKSTPTNEASNATSKRKADSTQPAKRKYVRNKLLNVEKDNTEAVSISEVKKSTRQGKRNALNIVSPVDTVPSPSILNEATTILKNISTESKESPINTEANPSLVDSRKTSTSECLSWTKDISSSSTTTTCMTVGSYDFFRIDKKLPILKLPNIDKEWEKIKGNRCDESDSSDSSSSSGSSSCSSSCSSLSESLQDSRSLNLSMSSISPVKTPNRPPIPSNEEKWEDTLMKLTRRLQDFDGLDDIEYELPNDQMDNNKTDIYQDKIYKLLKDENAIIKCCNAIENLLKTGMLGDCYDNEIVNETRDSCEKELAENTKDFTDKSEDEDNFTTSRSKYVMLEQTCTDEEDPLQEPVCNESSEDDNFTSDKVRYVSFDRTYNDDDDALSLFAESITGLESSKLSSSANSVCANVSDPEEYIPQPKIIRVCRPERPTYVPTRITYFDAPEPDKTTVYEKKNADSTSPYAAGAVCSQTMDSANQTIQNNTDTPLPVQKQMTNIPKKSTLLLSSIHKPLTGVKSVIFRGVCFYNLISNCKKTRCCFPHKKPETLEICNKLTKLKEDLFIQEYMLLRGWPDIRRTYGICYVSECINRKLTRVLIEMAIDFFAKAKMDSSEDAALKIHVIEKTLLYLNDTDLSTCEDLLQYEFGKGVLLCDVFMQTIAETQNFSRFKVVFIKLTNFITGIGRKFQLHDASCIFERVCILPYEEQLVRAVLKIIENTDEKILENSMIPQFEKVLSSRNVNPDLYNEFCSLKKRVCLKYKEVRNEVEISPHLNEDHTNNSAGVECRYMSDKSDNSIMDMSNQSDEQTPKTVQKVIRPTLLNHVFTINRSANDVTEDNRPQVQMKNFWRPNRGKINNMGMRFPGPVGRMRPPMAKQCIDQRHVMGPRPRAGYNKLPHRYGPKFF